MRPTLYGAAIVAVYVVHAGFLVVVYLVVGKLTFTALIRADAKHAVTADRAFGVIVVTHN